MGSYRGSNPLHLTVLTSKSEDYTTAPQHPKQITKETKPQKFIWNQNGELSSCARKRWLLREAMTFITTEKGKTKRLAQWIWFIWFRRWEYCFSSKYTRIIMLSARLLDQVDKIRKTYLQSLSFFCRYSSWFRVKQTLECTRKQFARLVSGWLCSFWISILQFFFFSH